ncbi:MAG: 4-(cytidine 5'-diphospho)-2-C-methyl-D-erythritol kinase [Actinobacteria bacterium]|nr:4-(cytidine 5'-diphospho)-2-C-methyl-D-erythritol kinase [Actinomycetota bacterium]MBU4386784.1 4-(cytidine 5'-diphospho)-2-C-methyl-D-erythritol kinase [Actinomycetota bacterium]MBU4489031.1 4-(cytidine 5'-diphospho)-2-C-methyl-D-erythritol kinase [Actinomycetota bacterium]MCG2796100.1 4-(cytidine 5'-diphospho)-2-C-methyl-D-erythritol kinase [Actinomycetes bacterium]
MLGAKAIARAKINLFLQVGPRREDGYHEIRSVMQSLELYDELFFRRTDGSGGKVLLRCNDKNLPTGADNLIWRALEVFEGEAGPIDGGVEVFINKMIPMGAGLAGGSADAAATLLALDHIYELELSADTLMDMAARIGSDVPFCMRGGTVMATGRGERLEPLEHLPPFPVVLATPDEEASTAEVYERFDLLLEDEETHREDEAEQALDALLEGVRKHDVESVYSNLRNNLESATIATKRVEEYKSVAREAGASAVLMTGSGPTVFALVSGMDRAAEVAWELEKIAPITIVTSFSDRGAEIKKL